MRLTICKHPRPLAVLLCLLLLFTAVPAAAQTASNPIYQERYTAEVAPYFPNDTAAEPWAEETILDLIHAGIVEGYDTPGGITVNPRATITRAEFVALLVRALNLQPAAGGGRTFADVPRTAWYYDVVNTASSLGIINGKSPTRFEPNQNIRRDEIAKIISVAFSESVNFNGPGVSFGDVPANHWAAPYINLVSAAEIVNGYDTTGGKVFRPANNAKRAEAMTMLQRALRSQSYATPADTDLQTAVLTYEDAFYANYSANDWAAQLAAQERHTTGFTKALSDFNVRFLQEQAAHGARVEVTRLSDPSVNVLAKSDQFAIVELVDNRYHMIASAPGVEPQGKDYDLSAILYLRKMPDGAWKIYSSISTGEEAAETP